MTWHHCLTLVLTITSIGLEALTAWLSGMASWILITIETQPHPWNCDSKDTATLPGILFVLTLLGVFVGFVSFILLLVLRWSSHWCHKRDVWLTLINVVCQVSLIITMVEYVPDGCPQQEQVTIGCRVVVCVLAVSSTVCSTTALLISLWNSFHTTFLAVADHNGKPKEKRL